MINISNSASIDKPSWRLEASASPEPRSGQSEPGRAAVRRLAPDGTGIRGLGALITVGWLVLSWLAAIPARLGDRLFAINDTEAYWRDWEIIKTRSGLGRRYRDPQFDTLAECPRCSGTGGGAGGTAAVPCLPCAGTGRITCGEVS